jgi:hypothetical protein
MGKQQRMSGDTNCFQYLKTLSDITVALGKTPLVHLDNMELIQSSFAWLHS